MYIKVEVSAGAKRESVLRTAPDSFVVSVREKAERNAANRRVLEIIRQAFSPPASSSVGRGIIVKIISGHHSPRKIISVDIKK